MQKQALFIKFLFITVIVAVAAAGGNEIFSRGSSASGLVQGKKIYNKAPASKSSKKPKKQTSSFIMPVHPTKCVGSHGFDGLRTNETFVINPTNNKEMYVHIEFRGLYKSSDGGKTWQFSGTGIEAWPRADDPAKPCYMEYMSMYIDPFNSNRLLLVGGSAPGKVSDPMNRPGGLHESLDAGKSWHQLFAGGMNAYTTQAAIDPKDPKIIYVAHAALPSNNNPARQDELFITKGLVYKTVDGGKTWKELPTGFVKHARVMGIAINSNDSNHLLIGVTAIPPNTGGGTILPNQMGIVETKDGGATWKKLEGLPEKYRGVRIFDASADLSNVFVYGQSGKEDDRAFYSLDGGATFTEVPLPVNFARFDPNDSTGMHLFGFNMYAQPKDFFESLDGGKSWNTIGTLPKEVDNDNRPTNIVFDPLDKNTVYLNGGKGRVWKSTDKGKTWELILSLEKLGK